VDTSEKWKGEGDGKGEKIERKYFFGFRNQIESTCH
jgi:hypothetical protein